MSDAMITAGGGTIVRPIGGGAQVARQGFGESSMERRDTAAVAVAERAKAEIQARYIIALQRPRHVEEVRLRILDHCKRPRFAEKARYSKPVGGGTIEGPSIRFVEAALAEFGNVVLESTVVHEDDERIQIRVSVVDLERNVCPSAEATIIKRVERRSLKKGQTAISQRMNSEGVPVFLVAATDDDIANLKASRESKLLRNLGLRMLPADIVEEAMDVCVETLQNRAAKDPTAERKLIAEKFHELGVSPRELADYLGKPLEALQPADLVNLRAVFAALRDGEATWADVSSAKRAERAPDEPAAASAEPRRGVDAAKARLANRRKEAASTAASTIAQRVEDDTRHSAIIDAGRAVVDSPPAELDELATEIKALFSGLERVIAEPTRLPGLRDRIARLPAGKDRETLENLLARCERALAEPPTGG